MKNERINYVLDTNIILHEATSILKFEEHQVILPITVLEELDNFKKKMDETGRNARHFSRLLDDLRDKGKLADGVPLNEKGGTLVVRFSPDRPMLPPEMDLAIADNRILAIARHLQDSGPGRTILVTNDTNLRVKADTLGIPAEAYEHDTVDVSDLYTGVSTLEVASEVVDHLYQHASIEPITAGVEEPFPNHCVTLVSRDNPKQAVLTRYNPVMKELTRLPQDLTTFGLTPRSAEQQYALSLLLDPDIPLVTLIGLAGSGKTLCALAAGLHCIMEDKRYKKLMLLKPVVAMGNSNQLGFLPGTMEEKLAPWMASYFDNLDFLMGEKPLPASSKVKKGKKVRDPEEDYEKGAARLSPAQELIAHGIMEVGSLEHLRGRSLPGQFIIADEIQNTSPEVIRSILTRAGEGTKIVLLGDISQIDAPYLSAESNGLSYVADRFQRDELSGHILLRKSERSKLAERAAELL